MSMLDSFFNKGFKAPRCKTLLKLTIPRIKLLRNRREIQLKQMRRDIAKLLETGQEATARIRVEHIIREEKMMAAQEIVELFCELISVRLPIIESQRECPLDLKEAISSICFAAPRCADLPELIQVQMLFAGKYGKEFVVAATELMPECGVNRQLIELLSVRAPAPDVKLKLLKDIAEEHELDWDPAASEAELLKPHEDLLNGPTQFVSGTKVPPPQEKNDDDVEDSASEQVPYYASDSDAGFDTSDFPEVPKASVHPSTGTGAGTAPEMLPFPASALSGLDPESPNSSDDEESYSDNLKAELEEMLQDKSESKDVETPTTSVGEDKQFLPFISPPPPSSTSFPLPPSSTSFERKSNPPPSVSRTNTEVDVDLLDVLAAARAAASSAEHAAAAARSAASLAEFRINELVSKRNVSGSDITDSDVSNSLHSRLDLGDHPELETTKYPEYDNSELNSNPSIPDNLDHGQYTPPHQPKRLDSLEDESYLSYPNLFSRGPNSVSREPSFDDKYDSAGKH
ncbi:Spindle pole body protein [Heracleum sosnowskyi]|uniref:Spindle pole body protein n=1 Tax=Heracleum sosnowskyi TaxID=360622 RepID=A0AAD8HIS0_9APIA|nr:Spindle pole body protein [Heracleum sosnowskyi]